MDIIRLFILVLCLFLFDCMYIFVGYMIFKIGKLFKLKFFISFGFKLIAMGFAPFFGLGGSWLAKNCPYSSCDSCRLWTCSKY